MNTDTIFEKQSEVAAPEITDFKVGFGGDFLTKENRAADLFIYEDFDEEALMMGEMVKDFCIKEIQEPFERNGRELEVTKPEDKAEVLAILKRAGELGLCGVTIPEEYGGMNLDFKTNTLISMNTSRGFSFATTLGAQTSIGCLPIVYYGNESQKAKYLPKIASAEYVAAYALTEPNAGSDANAGKTKATLSEDGTHYVLNGQKIWITNGGFADVYVVFAKIDDDKNLSAFIVERTFEGFSTGAEEKKFGIKGSSTVAIFFDNCKVPVENLLGERQGGFKMALTILNGGRIKAGAGATGGALHALELGVDYAKTRQQFGKSISEFGVIQAKLGDIATQAFATEAAVFRTADLIDNKIEELVAKGIAANEAKVKAVREFAIEAAIIKVRGSELACHALDEVMQIHGGMGYAFETGIGMGYRDARITKIYEGTNEVNSMLAVGELFKRAMQTKEVDLKTVGGKIPSFLVSRLNPFRDKSESIEQERIVKGLKYTFLYVSNIAGRKLKEELINEQEIVMNLSTILQESFLSESAWLKAKKLSQRSNEKDLELQRQQLRLYLYLSLAKAKAAAKEAVASIESGRKQRQHNRIIDLLLQPYLINPKEVRRSIAKTILK